MLKKIDVIIILVAAIAVTIFDIILGNSLLHLSISLIITIIAFSIIGYIVKRILTNWFGEKEEDEEAEEIEEDMQEQENNFEEDDI